MATRPLVIGMKFSDGVVYEKRIEFDCSKISCCCDEYVLSDEEFLKIASFILLSEHRKLGNFPITKNELFSSAKIDENRMVFIGFKTPEMDWDKDLGSIEWTIENNILTFFE